MNFLLALITATAITLIPKSSVEPTYSRDWKERNLFKFVNPTNKSVSVSISCGIEWLDVNIIIQPNTKEVFYKINEPDGVPALNCIVVLFTKYL